MNGFRYFDIEDSVDDACAQGSCDCCCVAVRTGAAIAFGLVGMAETIRQRGLRETYGERFVVVEPTCIHGLYNREHCQACEDLENAEPFV